MEGPPKPEAAKSEHESVASFEEQLSLAKNLSNAVNTRNIFIREHGGDFDTFAESWQHVEGMRGAYDQMEEVVAKTRAEFDEKVSDKKEFVGKVRSTGDDALADMIQSMFGVKKSLLSRVLRRKK